MHKIKLFCLVLLMYACSDDCGQSLSLGTFELSEVSRQFIPYSGNETLVFEDHNGRKHRLYNTEGRRMEEDFLQIGAPCKGDANLFSANKPSEFYQTQKEIVSYVDSVGNTVFYLELKTAFEETNDPEESAIYDLLSIFSLMPDHVGHISIITEERKNQITSAHRYEQLNSTISLGDTTLYGRRFNDVYAFNSLSGPTFFYNQEKGVLAFRIRERGYWVLSE